jgi:hypothetical protein
MRTRQCTIITHICGPANAQLSITVCMCVQVCSDAVVYGLDDCEQCEVFCFKCSDVTCNNTLVYDGMSDSIFNYDNKNLFRYSLLLDIDYCIDTSPATFAGKWDEIVSCVCT